MREWQWNMILYAQWERLEILKENFGASFYVKYSTRWNWWDLSYNFKLKSHYKPLVTFYVKLLNS